MDDDLQVKAKALGDPTRHSVFRYLVDVDRPVDVAELTGHFDLHHTATRQHLAKRVAAGLVVESSAAPTGRGRPRLEYTIEPSVDSRWGVTGPYERLSMLLTEMIRTGASGREIGRRAAARFRLGGATLDESPVEIVVDQMARQGFAPQVSQRAGVVEIVLEECPYASAVLTDADTICQMHLGMAEGVADAVEGIEVVELIPKDPRGAHCRLRCRTTT